MISRICRLAWDYPSRGESTYGLQPVFANLSQAQVKQGFEVHVIALRSKNQPAEETCNGVEVHRVPGPFALTGTRMMRRLMKDDNGWVAHTHGTCGAQLSLVRHLGRFPLVAQVHGTSRSHHVPLRIRSGRVVLDYSLAPITYDMLRERLLWKSADRILTVSRAISNDIVDCYGLDPAKISVVYNGVDSELFKPLATTDAPEPLKEVVHKKIILFVGHFGLRKGIFYLIRAMKQITREVSDAHLVCVGGVPSWLGHEDYWQILRHEIESSQVSNSVTLLGTQKNKDLVKYYNIARVFVLPSYYESISKVTLEAMACAKPVVSSRSGGLPEVVVDGTTGLLVDFGSVGELSSAVVELLRDEDKARRMGILGRRVVESNFTWTAVADRTRSVYKGL